MIAFDTDILSEILLGNPKYVSRASSIPLADRKVPVVAAAEMMRGWMGAIRMAEAGKGKMSLHLAFRLFEQRMKSLAAYDFLPYDAASENLFASWRAAKIRIGTQDLRIAAISFAHGATLVTRNARDYALVPGLVLDI